MKTIEALFMSTIISSIFMLNLTLLLHPKIVKSKSVKHYELIVNKRFYLYVKISVALCILLFIYFKNFYK